MILVCDTEPGLAKAAELATTLANTRQIQLWKLSDVVAGIELVPFTAVADVVRERGGYGNYHNGILVQFTSLGYKLYDPAAIAAEKAREAEAKKQAEAQATERERAAQAAKQKAADDQKVRELAAEPKLAPLKPPPPKGPPPEVA